MKIILASGSVHRRKILENLGLDFEVVVADYEENICVNDDCETQVRTFAEGKLKRLLEVHDFSGNVLIIAADTMVEFEGKTLGKPKSRDEAEKLLTSYAGKKQTIITGVSVYLSIMGQETMFSFTDTASLEFEEVIPETVLQGILDTNEWQGKCGGYSVMGWASFLIKNVEGDYNTIIGLPVKKLITELEAVLGDHFWTFLPKLLK